MLERVHMGGYEDHDPTELSGGQKQRVALARSLAVDPEVLLLDEPLSNLDKRLREEMAIELKDIHNEFEKTFVHVTHNQDEAFTLADRIGIMNEGRLVQVGEPIEVYRNPTNKFVEEFLGDTNFVSGELMQRRNGTGILETEFGTTIEAPLDEDLAPGKTLTLSLRPEFMDITPIESDTESPQAVADGTGSDVAVGVVKNTIYRGSTIRYIVDVNGQQLFVERSVTEQTDIMEGQQVEVSWPTEEMLVFHADGTRVGG
jgi:spermidine/putrescine transport system ATP-binding protein